MTDTHISEEVVIKETDVVNEGTDISQKQPSSDGIQDTTSKASDIKEVSVKSDILHTSVNIQEVAVPNQEGDATANLSRKSNEDVDQEYEEVEEEYEEQYEEDGETKVILKKRKVKVKRTTSLKSKKSLIEEKVEEEKLIEKGEFESDEIDETREITGSTKSQLSEKTAKQSKGSKDVEEVNFENDDTVSDSKRTNISVSPSTEGQQEKSEKSEIERGLSREEIAREEEETEEEEMEDGTSKKEVKEESKETIGVTEETEEMEITSESEKTSAASLTSAEKLLEEEKLVKAQQYEILKKLRNEHLALKRKNMFLNHKLVQYFRKQKMDHVFTEIKEDPAMEQQYLKKLALFYETNKQITEEKQKINTELEAQQNINKALMEKVKLGWDELLSHKREIAAKLIDPKTGRTVLCDKKIEDLINRQEAQMKQISERRLAQIKLKRRIEEKKIERQKQHAGKEFNLMDYEKLSSLKEYYIDKITERDIEIEEENQKMIALDNTLIQLKEQLQKKEDEVEQEKQKLQNIILKLNNKRANVSELKKARHKTEKNTAKIKQQSGLLAYPILLKDYEEKTQELKLLLSEVEELKKARRAALIRIRKLRETVKRRGRERESLGVSSTMTTLNDKSML